MDRKAAKEQIHIEGWLTVHRDFGGGSMQASPGQPRASRLLGTPVGLVVRQQCGLFIGWAFGLTALGLLYGAVIPTIPDLVASNPDIAQVFGASMDAEQAIIDAFLGYVFLFMAVISTGFVVTSVLRLRAEAESGRAESILATGVTRTSWVGAAVLAAGIGAVLLQLLMGLGLAVGYGLGMGEWDQVRQQVGGQLSYLPGVVLVAALAVAIAGLVPRCSGVTWIAVAFVFVQVILGQTLRLPDWIDGISPFWHLSRLPTEPLDAVPAIIELTLATTLVLLGTWGYRRRDIDAN